MSGARGRRVASGGRVLRSVSVDLGERSYPIRIGSETLPSAGREIARGLGEKPRGRWALLKPSTSVRFGSTYLASMLTKFGAHPALATAAYNAGPHRVRSWLPSSGEIEGDVWVENVPFTETRNYVRRVLAYTAIYQHRLGIPVQRIGERLAPVPALKN